MKYTIVIFLSLLIQSCVVVESYSDIKSGDVLVVKESLVIPAGKASITIQYGKVTPVTVIEVYHPRCWFVSSLIKQGSQIIQPGKFRILKVRETFESVRRSVSFPFATLSLSMFSGATAVEYFTEMDLASNRQQDINRLICSHWEDPYDAEHLTVKQINAALGELAKIIIQ